MTRRFPHGSRAFVALLLFCALFFLSACDFTQQAGKGAKAPKDAKTTGGADSTRTARDENTAAYEKTTTKAAEPAVDTAFVHRASEKNSRGDYTYLSDPGLDGDPNAVVIAAPMPDLGSTGDGDYDHNIGVWYEPEAQKWAIFNQDLAAVPGGSTFQVVVAGGPDKLVHRAGQQNIDGNSTYLDDPLLNGKPRSVLTVTQNWNPGGGNGTYNNHPVDVRYDAGTRKWTVYNTDGAAMPGGAAFNVDVSGDPQATGSGAGEAATDLDAKPAERADADTRPGHEAESSGDVQQEEAGDPTQGGGELGGFPEYRDFFSEGDPETPAKLVTSDSSTGAIPVVKPFNFGRDPGGPEDKTLYLSIPKLGLEDIPAFDTVSEEKLRDGTVHIPATGYPWQEGANVYIAGHRLGYEDTPSYYVFFRLNELVKGDEILLEDSAGGQYRYRVKGQKRVGPDSVDVMNPVDGESLVTLQTCTLPDYEERLIVQGELVEKDAKAA